MEDLVRGLGFPGTDNLLSNGRDSGTVRGKGILNLDRPVRNAGTAQHPDCVVARLSFIGCHKAVGDCGQSRVVGSIYG